jgi:hypothetical protein
MVKLFITIMIMGTPAAVIKTNLTFSTEQACVAFVHDEWDGNTIAEDVKFRIDCLLEV